MEIQASKIELIKMIADIESEQLINQDKKESWLWALDFGHHQGIKNLFP